VSEPAAAASFSAHAAQYTAERRRLVPVYDAFYGAVVEVLRLVGDPGVRRVLDLGAGTGLLSESVAASFPDATIDLLDASESMLREAREQLAGRIGAVHVVDMASGLPDGPFDAIVSALAIHHLEDDDKRILMGRARQRLRPGGVFVNAEIVAGPTVALSRVYEQRWIEDCLAAGATRAEIDVSLERARHDRCVDVEPQLEWLRAAGFAAADCVYKSWRFAVMAGFTEDS
jgi:tRNA (cmo5U34)-methyltransferase